MQEYLKKGNCAFALFFIVFTIIISLPCIAKVGELLTGHIDATYWSERTDRQVAYKYPEEKLPPPVLYTKKEDTVKLPQRPVITREVPAVKNSLDPEKFLSRFAFFGKLKKRILIFFVDKEFVEDAVVSNFPLRYEFSECNMAFKYLLGMKRPLEGENLFLLPNRMLSGISGSDDCKAAGYYADLAKKLNSKYLVVAEPRKIDFISHEYYGGLVKKREVQLAASVAKLKKQNIDVLFLRDFFKSKKMTAADIFYRGDHHWKSDAALLAAEHLADYMNKFFKTGYDLRYLRKESFMQERFKEIFIGSTAKKTTLAYSRKKEDFTVFTPLFKTGFVMEIMDSNNFYTTRTGDFQTINDYHQLYRNPYNSNPYAFFTRGDKAFIRITNKYCSKTQKIAFLKNSFANPVIPYFALQTSEIIVFDERFLTMTQIAEKLLAERPDIIIYFNSSFDGYYKENDANF